MFVRSFSVEFFPRNLERRVRMAKLSFTRSGYEA